MTRPEINRGQKQTPPIDPEERTPPAALSADGEPPSPRAETKMDLATLRQAREGLIERAARRVASTEGNGNAGAEAVLGETLRMLTEAAGRSDGKGGDLGDSAHHVAHRSRLLDLLGAEVVRMWTEAPSAIQPAEALDALASIQRVRGTLEPAGSGRFGSRLAEADGLELVVELAHDLRSPLTSILLLSETLRSGHSGELNGLQQRQLGLIYSAALGLVSVAGDVMELARGGGRPSEEEETAAFAVSQMLESVREMVQPMAEEKGIALRVLAPQVDHRRGLPIPLSRVLLNLTTNGLKFTDEGMVEIVARETSRTRVEFSVRDTGRGIGEAAQKRLFEPFRPGPRAAGHLFSGTGLGLSIARRLVEGMGSSLEFETRFGWGTRFFFELDLPPASEF